METKKAKYKSLSEYRKAQPLDYQIFQKDEKLEWLCEKFGWEYTTKSDVLENQWEEKFQSLKEFVKNKKRLPVQKEKLGSWCNSQRQNFKKGILSKERIKNLESIDGWFWDNNIQLNQTWKNIFQSLKEFVKNKKRLPVQKENTLGSWCSNQRENFKKGILSKERIKILESIDGWFWDNFDEQWEENFQLLKDFIKNNKKFPIQRGNTLGSWCGTQRRNFKKGILSKERIKNLESIDGWFWEKDFDEQWEESFQLLKEFVKNKKRFPVQSEIQLFNWIHVQRKNFKKGILSKEKIKILESINGWMWSVKDQWNEKLLSLKDFIKNNNRFPSQKETKLFSWCSDQRRNFKKGILSKERIKNLESIDGWFWEKDFDEQWEESFQSLKEFIKNNKVFPSWKEKLGIWIHNQRKNFKKGILSKERIKKLKTLGVI